MIAFSAAAAPAQVNPRVRLCNVEKDTDSPSKQIGLKREQKILITGER